MVGTVLGSRLAQGLAQRWSAHEDERECWDMVRPEAIPSCRVRFPPAFGPRLAPRMGKALGGVQGEDEAWKGVRLVHAARRVVMDGSFLGSQFARGLAQR